MRGASQSVLQAASEFATRKILDFVSPPTYRDTTQVQGRAGRNPNGFDANIATGPGYFRLKIRSVPLKNYP